MADKRVLTDPQANWATSLFANFPIKWTAAMRGVLLGALAAALSAVASYFKLNPIPGQSANFTAVIVFILMWLFGVVDSYRVRGSAGGK